MTHEGSTDERQKLRRLADIKARYDPDNVFHLNHNIAPRPAEETV